MQRWGPSKHMAMVHVEISGIFFFYMTQEYTCWCPIHTCMPQLVGFAPIQCRDSPSRAGDTLDCPFLFMKATRENWD